jgi:hypothetical protein
MIHELRCLELTRVSTMSWGAAPPQVDRHGCHGGWPLRTRVVP